MNASYCLKRIVICISLCNTMHLFSFSQTSNSLVPSVNIPTSPEAALLGRFGDIPVGYYTGTADVTVPLYTIKEGSFELPIALRYHSSGIKVDDQATWVGLGWDLSPEGTIIQEVRGKQDDYDNKLWYDPNSTSGPYADFMSRIINTSPYGWSKGLDQIGFALYDPCLKSINSEGIGCSGMPPTQIGDDDASIIESLLENNGQPDIYHFNFAGYSGKFYIHPETQQIIQLDKKSQIYFTKNVNSDITATTLDGTVYTFDVTETAYELGAYAYSDKAGKTFKLSRIQFLNGNSIMFEYADAHLIDYNYSEAATMNDLAGTSNGAPPNLNTRQSDIKILTKITTTDAIIEFNLAEREDIIPNPNNLNNVKRLASVDIKSIVTGKKVRSFQFDYSYFPYTFDGVPSTNGAYPAIVTQYETAFGKRLKLNSLQEIGYDDNEVALNTKPPYLFEYNTSNTMPLKVSFAKDFWGYYNGASTNVNLLPDLDYFDYPYVYLANTLYNQPFVYTYQNKANRYTDNQKAGTYLLNKITYPTKGHTAFTYEPNSFTNQFIPDKSSSVFKSYDVQDNSLGGTSVTTFKLSKATTIHFENHINNGAGNYNGVTPLTYDQMAGCYISFSKVKMVNGSPVITLVKKWDLSTVLRTDFESSGGKAWIENLRVEFDSDPTCSYTLKVFFPDELNNPLFASIAGVSSHITYYDDTGVDISYSSQCGMRIKKITNYNDDGAVTGSKLIKYTGGKLLNHFSPIEMLTNCYIFSCTYNPTQPNDCPQFGQNGPFNRLVITSDGMVREGTMVGYDQVEETELTQDNNSNHGKKVFSYFNFENSADHRFPVIVNGLNGLISSEAIYNDQNEKLTEENYFYKNLNAGASSFYGVTINTHFFGGSGTDPAERADLGTRHKYSYNASPLISEWYKLDNKISTYYSNGQVLSKSEKYTYNSEGSISTYTIDNSKGEILVTQYYYPTDNLINPLIDDQMTLVHNTGTPVITEVYKGSIQASNLLSKHRTVYASVNSAPMLAPQYIYSQKGANPEERRVTINSYDDKGNITQYTEENNIPVSIVWNADKTLPVAKIENATYASLLALPSGLNSDFRISLPNARVITYTYKPLVGVSTITDANNRTSYYDYDAYGRLKFIKDQDGNIVKTFDYHYKQ